MVVPYQDGSIKDVNMTETKSEDIEQHFSGNTDNFLVNRPEVKVCSVDEGIRFSCRECGKQIRTQSNLNRHIRANHEGIKYPCSQCQYQATTKGGLIQHERSVHKGIKYPCGQCEY